MIWRLQLAGKSEIKLLRLIIGEDIISEFWDGEHVYTLNNPIVVVAMPGPAGAPPNIGFAPWMPYSKTRKFTLHIRDVICVTEALEQFITQYKSITSNLALPNKSLILPGK